MPGYGVSSGESPLTFERIADRVVELLDHLAFDSVDIVTHESLVIVGELDTETPVAYSAIGCGSRCDQSPYR